jgi:hypothetical protein
MATTTPNFGWPVPTSTDLVKDGAVAIEGLGDAIDASLLDLKGGTTGQVLAKASATDMDFSWVAQDDSNAIQNAIVDAKGDIIAATANDTPARLAVGANNTVLTADSTTATGLKWATPATSSSGLVLLDRDSFTAASSVIWDGVFTSTYKVYQVVIETLFGSSGAADLWFNFRYSNTTMAAQYYGSIQETISTTWSGVQWSALNSAERAIISNNVNSAANENISSVFNVFNVGTSSNRGGLYGQTLGLNPWYDVFGGYTTQLQTYNGFVLAPSTGTITGTVSIYGLATA